MEALVVMMTDCANGEKHLSLFEMLLMYLMQTKSIMRADVY